MWQPIETAPFEQSLELAVKDDEGMHALVFACHRSVHGWIDAGSGHIVAVRPTHWRVWREHAGCGGLDGALSA
jgi:hypothetical protein